MYVWVHGMATIATDDPDYDDLQAQFSIAYVEAIAATAGFWVETGGRGRDKDSVDLTILRRGPLGLKQSPALDVQIKSHRVSALDAEAVHIPYRLWKKNYDDLRIEMATQTSIGLQVPRILVVVLVPRDSAEWVHHTEDAAALRRCGYWMSLRGAPAITTDRTVVHLPRANVFNVPGLIDLMHRVATDQTL